MDIRSVPTLGRLAKRGDFILMFVPLIDFFSLQRYFVQGLLAGSVKA
jgi:ABC-type glycerol-3-phosphate transport system permease component